MATRRKSSRKTKPARQARRPARGRNSAGRTASARKARTRPAKRAAGRRQAESPATRQSLAASSDWSTLRVVWRPALAMATLPYRVYRVYRWAEAQSHRSSAPAASV